MISRKLTYSNKTQPGRNSNIAHPLNRENPLFYEICNAKLTNRIDASNCDAKNILLQQFDIKPNLTERSSGRQKHDT